MNPVLREALASWEIPYGFVLLVAITGALYARGFKLLHSQMADRFPYWRLACFLGGLAILLIAIASPLAAFDDLLLSVHMTQHILLMFAAPPMLLLGAPAVPLLRGLPAAIVRSIPGPILKQDAARRAGKFITHPVTCWMVLEVTSWGWHIPWAYQVALRSEWWHEVEHGCFIGAAMLFWWPVIQPWPSVARWSRWTMIPYLLLADLQNTIFSALLTFSGRLIYPFYATAPHIDGITPLNDQVLAGVIMWVPASLVFLIPVALVVFRMLGPKNLMRSPRAIQHMNYQA